MFSLIIFFYFAGGAQHAAKHRKKCDEPLLKRLSKRDKTLLKPY